MSAVASGSVATLDELRHAARIVRGAVKDRSYRVTPLGLEVARYVRWKRSEWGATAETMRDYEPICAKLALYFADLELRDFEPPVGTERLRECWDHHWGHLAGRTRSKVRSVWVDFFDWAIRERGMHGNPARALAAPKKRDVRIDTYGPSLVLRIIAAQEYPADRAGTILVLRYGLRRGGLVNIRRRDFDFERKLLTVKTKGGRIYPLELRDKALWLALGRLDVEAQWQPGQWLLYHQDTRQRREDGYTKTTRRRHDREPNGKLAHRWWYRCLERAELVPQGTTHGMNLHRGRHTAATALIRSSHDLKLTQELLGHADIRSTARYAHLDTSDLADALAVLYESEDE